MGDSLTGLEIGLAIAAFFELRLAVGRVSARVRRLEEHHSPPGLPLLPKTRSWKFWLPFVLWLGLGASVLTSAGCFGRPAIPPIASTAGLLKPIPFRPVNVQGALSDVSAMLNVCIGLSLMGFAVSVVAAFALRTLLPIYARASLGAAVGFGAVIGLASCGKIALPLLPWIIGAGLAAGLIAGIFYLRHHACIIQNRKPSPLQ